VDSSVTIETDSRLLFNDLAYTVNEPDIIEYCEAFLIKLRVVRYFQTECLRLAKELMHTMMKEKKEEKIVPVSTGALLFRVQIHLECFFYFTTSALDILAKLTREFYPKNKSSISGRNFRRIIAYFSNTGSTLDSDFSRLIRTQKDWILNVYNNRDTFAHFDAVFVGFEHGGKIKFETRKPKETRMFREKEYEDLSDYLKQTTHNLYNFLDSYAKHFRKRIPKSERTRILGG